MQVWFGDEALRLKAEARRVLQVQLAEQQKVLQEAMEAVQAGLSTPGGAQTGAALRGGEGGGGERGRVRLVLDAWRGWVSCLGSSRSGVLA